MTAAAFIITAITAVFAVLGVVQLLVPPEWVFQREDER